MICPYVLQWCAAILWSRAIALFRNSLVESSLAPGLGRGVPSDLIGSLWLERRHWCRLAVAIDGDEGEIAGVGVKPHSCEEILRLHPHSDFHRCPADVVHAGLHDVQVPYVNRLPEI